MALDISIKNLKTHVFQPKTEKTRRTKAEDVLSHSALVQEKVDGTKLTLIRTDKNDSNFANNWVVSYKGTVLYSDEFEHLTNIDLDNIKSKSVGVGQYALVFEHLKSINSNISEIPHNTEFSIEFVQNKDTLTRTYENFGGMFLRSYSKTRYYIQDNEIISTAIGSEVTDVDSVKEMAKKLDVMSFPVIFEGNLYPESEFIKGIKSSDLKSEFKKVKIDWTDSLDVVEKLSTVFLNVDSVLGGMTEGVVLKLDDGRFFKFVQQDQYDKDVRDAKKGQYKMSAEEETQYFIRVRKLISALMNKIDTNQSDNIVLKKIQSLASKLPAHVLPTHEKKNDIQIKDDIHDTARLMLGKLRALGSTTKTLGVIPIAGKPLHIGHWKLILLAAKENDRVIVYTSLKDRKRAGEVYVNGQSFAKFWNEYFIPELPDNVKVKFNDSPVRYALFELRWLDQLVTQDNKEIPTVRLYSDTTDVDANFPDDLIEKNAPALMKMNKIERRGIDRDSTVNISGTEMRQFLANGEKGRFEKYLPPVNQSAKEDIWNIMTNDMKSKITAKEQIQRVLHDLIKERVTPKKILAEGGDSSAMVDPKTVKTIQGEPAKPSTKLDASQNTSKVVSDIKELVMELNKHVKFWDPENPYLHNGYMFNGSSQHLMNPNTTERMVKMKPTYGDVDTIVPKTKLDELDKFLDEKLDDNKTEWAPTESNKLTPNWYYVGRPKSYAKIPDQTVTIWYYKPKQELVQFDFEGDTMETVEIEGKKFLKPSFWAKFSKSSPIEDLDKQIKGLSHKILLRALTRSVYDLGDVAVVTRTGKVSNSKKHRLPSQYTFNPAGEDGGMRQAYEPKGEVDVDGKKTPAYEFIEAKVAKATHGSKAYIKELPKIFQMLFGADPVVDPQHGWLEQPEKSDLKRFESFVGMVDLIKQAHAENRMSDTTIKTVAKYFLALMKDTGISEQEMMAPVKYMVKELKSIIKP